MLAPRPVVPREVGAAIDAAYSDIRSRGFRPEIETVSDSHSSAGVVLSQWPLPSSLSPRGSHVLLSVSGPRSRFRMPSLIGVDAAAADRYLSNQGITLLVRRGYTSRWPAGVLVDQHPAAGSSLPPHGQVVAVLNEGAPVVQAPAPAVPQPVKVVPALVGKTFGEARYAAWQNGFLLQAQNSTMPGDSFLVTSQSPTAGSRWTVQSGQNGALPVAVTVSAPE
ncbi:MAG TPA: hypothetical protein VGO93_13965 [Candidatus Xenobia bacterium]